MEACLIRAPGDVEVREVARPDPGPGQVVLRVAGCGVCGSDLAAWQGRPWFDYPFPPGAPGHEPWGVVEAIGEGVTGVSEGAPAAAVSHRAHAQYDIVDAPALVPIPDELAGRPFPGEALGCAMNVFRRSGITSASTVAVVGIGFLGAVVTQLAADRGARVIAISRRRFALDVGRTMGAHDTVTLDDDTSARVEDLTDGERCDVVIEAAGKQETLDAGAAITKTRGRLLIAGYHQDGTRTVNMQMWNWRGIDVINAHERDAAIYVEGMRLIADLMAQGRVDPSPLYTHEFPLARLGDAFRTAEERPDGFLKAVIRP